MTNAQTLFLAVIVLFALLTVSYCLYKQEERLVEGLKRLKKHEDKIKGKKK